MKRRIITGLVICLALVACLFTAASAADDPLTVSMELSTNKFTAPKEITVSIKVSNAGEGDMPGPVTLYYPNGKQVEEFGSPTLAVGTSQSWSGTWKVTQAQLDKGKITFKIKYSVYNDAGELLAKTKNFSKAITYEGEAATIEVNRTITPTTAKKGQEVSITYDIVNSGNVDVSNVSIKENSSISSKKGAIDAIKAGEKGSYTFTVKMGTKNLTSSATITYEANGKTQTTKKESATIKYGEVKLTATLAADKKGGTIGDAAKLTLTLKNTGKVDYSDIAVTDALLGDVFSGITVKAGETVTLDKELTLEATHDYQFSVKGKDPDGNDIDTATGRVTLTAMDPAQAISLAVTATADREVVYSIPGTVKFTVTVTNESAIDVKDVDVKAGTVQLYNFPEILSGESRNFVRDVSVSMAGQYQFTATCKDQLNTTLSFTSNVIPISYSAPTAVPTEAPIITPPAPQYQPAPTDDGLPSYVGGVQRALGTLRWVFLVLAIVCGLLMLVGLLRRMQQKRQSDAAMDHLERGNYRDYSQPAPKEKEKAKLAPPQDEPVTRPIGEDMADPDLPDVGDAEEDNALSGDIMAETLRKLYPRSGQSLTADPTLEDGEEAPADEDVPLTEDESAFTAGSDGSYRLMTADTEDEPEADDVQAEGEVYDSADDQPTQDEPAAPRRHRRSQRHQDEA